MTRELDLTADLIDVRDIIARVEELETARDDGGEMEGIEFSSDDLEELTGLRALLSDLKGMGGDEQFEGDWYPVTLIDESYFKTYAQDLAEDIGAINADATWPNNCIDWDKAARELRMDYSAVSVAGRDYLTR